MIKTTTDIVYNRIKNTIGFDRSEEHLKFIRQFGEPHHLFGSYSQSIKTSDYATIPIRVRETHDKAERDKSGFAIDNLHVLLEYLILRIKVLEGKCNIKEKK